MMNIRDLNMLDKLRKQLCKIIGKFNQNGEVLLDKLEEEKKEFLQDYLEQRYAKENKQSLPKNRTLIGRGFDIRDKKKHKLFEVSIDNENRKNHIFLFGSTGVGKTRTAELMITQDIHAGRNIVYIDPKSDLDIMNTIVSEAIKANRLKDVMFVSTVFPEFSVGDRKSVV